MLVLTGEKASGNFLIEQARLVVPGFAKGAGLALSGRGFHREFCKIAANCINLEEKTRAM
jgi:hypothetical protein